MAAKEAETPVEKDAGADRYPKLKDVFAKVLQAEGVPEDGIMHLVVHTFASGDATWQCWVRGEDDARGGYIEE
jgi:hypothetical protein